MEPFRKALGKARQQFRIFCDLIKLRLTALVVLITLLGHLLGSQFSGKETAYFLLFLLSFLLCGSLQALNQYMERDYDALMLRTRNRPIPRGDASPRQVLHSGLAGMTLSFLLFWWFFGLLSLGIALMIAFSYLLVYTPLKRKTTLNTLAGCIPGAFPPVLGWATVTQSIDFPAVGLFLLLFFWQIPHFLAIAYLCQDDYRKAGFKMITFTGGTLGGRSILIYTAAMILVSVNSSLMHMTEYGIFVLGALVLGLGLFGFAWRMAFWPSHRNALALLKGSVIYLPLFFALIYYTPLLEHYRQGEGHHRGHAATEHTEPTGHMDASPAGSMSRTHEHAMEGMPKNPTPAE